MRRSVTSEGCVGVLGSDDGANLGPSVRAFCAFALATWQRRTDCCTAPATGPSCMQRTGLYPGTGGCGQRPWVAPWPWLRADGTCLFLAWRTSMNWLALELAPLPCAFARARQCHVSFIRAGTPPSIRPSTIAAGRTVPLDTLRLRPYRGQTVRYVGRSPCYAMPFHMAPRGWMCAPLGETNPRASRQPGAQNISGFTSLRNCEEGDHRSFRVDQCLVAIVALVVAVVGQDTRELDSALAQHQTSSPTQHARTAQSFVRYTRKLTRSPAACLCVLRRSIVACAVVLRLRGSPSRNDLQRRRRRAARTRETAGRIPCSGPSSMRTEVPEPQGWMSSRGSDLPTR
nr:hypothetical protein CFP56_13050 [Quercus suber]